MEWLNYHHLRYFWSVVRYGTITAACEELDVSQPTVTAQLKSLEKALGQPLFEKSGRTLALTEAGKVVYEYAQEIFQLGREMCNTLRGWPDRQRPTRLTVGVTYVVPKLIVHRLLQPALALPEPIQLVCLEGEMKTLLSKLSTHDLDLVLSDMPLPADMNVKAFNHMLGECGVSFFASQELATKYRKGFPHSLDKAPFLLPGADTALRRSLEHWFDNEKIAPFVRGEFVDSALTKVFGQEGLGVFATPTVIEKEVRRQYRVALIGQLEAVRESFYAFSVERKLKHPAVVAITEAARTDLFA
ncbi:MAG: transcriptional activator NhaR [Gemmataceae bacterium]